MRAPSPATDLSLNVQYFSEAGPSRTGFLVGAGLTQDLAPTLTSYYNTYYDTQAQIIRGDLGLVYQVSRQLSVVTGFEVITGVSYLGVSYNIGAR